MSSSSNIFGAIMAQSVWPWQRSGSTRTFTGCLLSSQAGDVKSYHLR